MPTINLISAYKKWLSTSKIVIAGLLATALRALFPVGMSAAKAEYADVVINNYSDKAKVRPVIFPHWFHRIRYTYLMHESTTQPHMLDPLVIKLEPLATKK